MLLREGVEAEQVGFCLEQQACHLRRSGHEPLGHLGKALTGLGARGGGEDLADRRGDHRLLGLVSVPQHVAQEVHRAALPRAADHLADRGPEPCVGIRDTEAHAGEAAGPERAQELAPEGL